MSDPNKVRINELARELEIKAKTLIEFLPETGFTEKVTHSSSISVEVAEKARRHFLGMAEAESAAETAKADAEKAAKAAKSRPNRTFSKMPSVRKPLQLHVRMNWNERDEAY